MYEPEVATVDKSALFAFVLSSSVTAFCDITAVVLVPVVCKISGISGIPGLSVKSLYEPDVATVAKPSIEEAGNFTSSLAVVLIFCFGLYSNIISSSHYCDINSINKPPTIKSPLGSVCPAVPHSIDLPPAVTRPFASTFTALY